MFEDLLDEIKFFIENHKIILIISIIGIIIAWSSFWFYLSHTQEIWNQEKEIAAIQNVNNNEITTQQTQNEIISKQDSTTQNTSKNTIHTKNTQSSQEEESSKSNDWENRVLNNDIKSGTNEQIEPSKNDTTTDQRIKQKPDNTTDPQIEWTPEEVTQTPELVWAETSLDKIKKYTERIIDEYNENNWEELSDNTEEIIQEWNNQNWEDSVENTDNTAVIDENSSQDDTESEATQEEEEEGITEENNQLPPEEESDPEEENTQDVTEEQQNSDTSTSSSSSSSSTSSSSSSSTTTSWGDSWDYFNNQAYINIGWIFKLVKIIIDTKTRPLYPVPKSCWEWYSEFWIYSNIFAYNTINIPYKNNGNDIEITNETNGVNNNKVISVNWIKNWYVTYNISDPQETFYWSFTICVQD